MNIDYRDEPRLDALGFDPRLMTADRLLTLAGQIRLKQGTARLVRSLDCADCGKAVEILTDEAGKPYTTTPMTILSAALRHQVLRHELSLSGGRN